MCKVEDDVLDSYGGGIVSQNGLGARDAWDLLVAHSIIPHARMTELAQKQDRLIFERGDGIYLVDSDGKEYLDALGGIYCLNVGYGNRRVISAIKEQASKLQFMYYGCGLTEASAELYVRLGTIAPGSLSRVLLTTTGADANEAALKIARGYHQGANRATVISLVGGFHGNTYGTTPVTGNDYYNEVIEPNIGSHALHIPPPNCYRCHYNLTYPECKVLCATMLEDKIQEVGSRVAAFVAEPILAQGGVIIPPEEYWPIARKICEHYGVLLVLDEIVTGLGRTGELFGCQQWGIVPDILTVGKGLASMYQLISAVITTDKVFDALKDSNTVRHSHTGSGHPISCAAAVANIEETLERDLTGNAKERGNQLLEELQRELSGCRIVGDIRGMGLLCGVEVVKSKTTRERFPNGIRQTIVEACKAEGLLVTVSGYNSDTIILSPPLTITEGQIADVSRSLVAAVRRVSDV